MHIQIHTNLAKYELKLTKKDITRYYLFYFCTLLIYEQNYTSLLYTKQIVLLLQQHLFTAVNKL